MAIIRTDTSPELWQIVLDVLVALGTVGAVVADIAVRSCRPQYWLRYHAVWQPGQVQTAAGGGTGRRSAKNAARPLHQSREAHHPARPHHSPEAAPDAPNPRATVLKRPDDPSVTALIQSSGPPEATPGWA
jgi:hypothetical protein